MKLIATCCRQLAAAALLVTVIHSAPRAQESQDQCFMCADAESLIESLSLREARTPVRERPGWESPRRIVIAGPEGFASFIQSLAPDATVVHADTADGAAGLIEGADVYFGLCTPELLRRGTDLKWIQIMRAGTESCTAHPEPAERDILVTNLQRLFGPPIAEHALAMMLSHARGLNRYARQQAAGSWSFNLRNEHVRISQTGREIAGKTVLVVGLGGLGTQIAAKSNALGMRVIATRNSSREGPAFVEYVGLADELPELTARADFVVSAVPLTAQTDGMFDRAFFKSMKQTAVFINVGRGETVATDDLVAALDAGEIAGAGLDVTDPEPLPPGHPLWDMQNVILTPHVSAVSGDGFRRVQAFLAENVRRYVAGDRMLSVVDVRRGY